MLVLGKGSVFLAKLDKMFLANKSADENIRVLSVEKNISCLFWIQRFKVKHRVKQTYCWWLKSCTTWNVKKPVNNGIKYQPQPSSRISEPSTVVIERSESECMASENG